MSSAENEPTNPNPPTRLEPPQKFDSGPPNEPNTLPVAQDDDPSTLGATLKTILIGKPRNLADESLFKHLSLIAFLAWVGLGADGLSSSCYGPAEAFRS